MIDYYKIISFIWLVMKLYNSTNNSSEYDKLFFVIIVLWLNRAKIYYHSLNLNIASVWFLLPGMPRNYMYMYNVYSTRKFEIITFNNTWMRGRVRYVCKWYALFGTS